MSLPIAFVRQDARYIPVAVLGLEPTTNLFVAPMAAGSAPIFRRPCAAIPSR
jgi:hypothetical protein